MSGARIQVQASAETIAASDGQVTLSVPVRLKRRSGRKLVTLPTGAGLEAQRPWDASATPLQLALARGFRWLRMLESSDVASMSEIARQEGGDPSYVARMVNLTTLAPDIIAAILDEDLAEGTLLIDLAINPRERWDEQRAMLDVLNISGEPTSPSAPPIDNRSARS